MKFNLYIKMVNEKYLEVVKSKAFLSSYSENLRSLIISVIDKSENVEDDS